MQMVLMLTQDDYSNLRWLGLGIIFDCSLVSMILLWMLPYSYQCVRLLVRGYIFLFQPLLSAPVIECDSCDSHWSTTFSSYDFLRSSFSFIRFVGSSLTVLDGFFDDDVNDEANDNASTSFTSDPWCRCCSSSVSRWWWVDGPHYDPCHSNRSTVILVMMIMIIQVFFNFFNLWGKLSRKSRLPSRARAKETYVQSYVYSFELRLSLSFLIVYKWKPIKLSLYS